MVISPIFSQPDVFIWKPVGALISTALSEMILGVRVYAVNHLSPPCISVHQFQREPLALRTESDDWDCTLPHSTRRSVSWGIHD